MWALVVPRLTLFRPEIGFTHRARNLVETSLECDGGNKLGPRRQTGFATLGDKFNELFRTTTNNHQLAALKRQL